MRSSLFFW